VFAAESWGCRHFRGSGVFDRFRFPLYPEPTVAVCDAGRQSAHPPGSSATRTSRPAVLRCVASATATGPRLRRAAADLISRSSRRPSLKRRKGGERWRVRFARILLKKSLFSLIMQFHRLRCVCQKGCEGPHRVQLKQRGARVPRLRRQLIRSAEES
jgi:hypothetical protein